MHLVLGELGIDADFFVEKFEIAGDFSSCDLTLASLDASAYAWSTAEEGTAPVAPVDTSNTVVPPVPTGLVLELAQTETTAGVFQVRIRATVDVIAGSAWETVGRYRRVGDTEWIDMADDGDWAVTTPVLPDGVAFEVQAAHAGFGGSATGPVGPWTDFQTITAIADGVAPNAPTGLAVAAGSGSATVSWFSGTAANYFSSVVYRAAVNDFSAATIVATAYGSPGQFTSHTETPAPDTYYWWVVSKNRSGAASAPSGPVSGTVT